MKTIRRRQKIKRMADVVVDFSGSKIINNLENPITFTINEIPVSKNIYDKWHWAKQAEYNNLWRMLTFAALKQNRKSHGFTGRQVEIHFKYFFNNTRRDLQNFIVHGIYDALIGHIITDDCSKYVTKISSEYMGKVGKGGNQTIVEIIPK